VEGPLPPDVCKIKHFGGQVNTPGPVPQVSQVRQHLIQGIGVDPAIHPAGTVRGHLTELRLQTGDEAIIGVVTTGDAVQSVIVLQPQGDVPGLPVCPSVVGFGFGDHGGECLHWSFVVVESILQGQQRVRMPGSDGLPTVP
jgi:hypothetical protein